jgi:hypothetical protein
MQSISDPITDTKIHNFRVRNFTHESLEQDELSCLVQFIASLDVCKVCVQEIPKIQSSFGSNLDFSIDFETKTLDIRYGKSSVASVSGW